MCMTEKYKMSPYCRAEADYAFKLRKPIVPLMMQANWKPDGWYHIDKDYILFSSLLSRLKLIFFLFKSFQG